MVGLASGLHTTLVPVMEGECHYTIPHVRMAYKYKVSIQLFDCEYCTKTCEPYKANMSMFEVQKNQADRDLKKAQDILDARAKGLTVAGASDKECDEIIEKGFSTESNVIFSIHALCGCNNRAIGRE